MTKTAADSLSASAWRARFVFQAASIACLGVHFLMILSGMFFLYWDQMGGPFTHDPVVRSLQDYVYPASIVHAWGGFLYLGSGLLAAWCFWLVGMRLGYGRRSRFTSFAVALAVVLLGAMVLSHGSGLAMVAPIRAAENAGLSALGDLATTRTNAGNRWFDFHLRTASLVQVIGALLLIFCNLMLRSSRWKVLVAEQSARHLRT